MKELEIMTVCGFGVGSSLILKMKVDEALKKNGIKASVNPNDVTSALGQKCDLIFSSADIAEQLMGKTQIPIIIINNFMDIKEIEDKGLKIVRELME